MTTARTPPRREFLSERRRDGALAACDRSRDDDDHAPSLDLAVPLARGHNARVPLFFVLLACVFLLLVIRPGRDRYYGVFRYRNRLAVSGDDGLGRARGVQEEDLVVPWRLPAEKQGQSEDDRPS